MSKLCTSIKISLSLSTSTNLATTRHQIAQTTNKFVFIAGKTVTGITKCRFNCKRRAKTTSINHRAITEELIVIENGFPYFSEQKQ